MDKLIVSSYNNFSLLAHKVLGEESKNSLIIFDGSVINSDINLKNPAFILKHPNKQIMYICYESIYDGYIATIEYKNNNLKILNVVSSEGKSSCYLEFTPDMQYIININYWDSSISIHPINDGILQKASKIYRNSKINEITHIDDHLKDRQSTSHHHSCIFYKKKLYVPDLGTDKIDIFDYTNGEIVYNNFFQLNKGNGPRYSIINNDFMYIVNELSSSVIVINMIDNMTIVQSMSTVPKECKKNTCSGIQLIKNYLYISNRGHDSIAIYKILDNNLLDLCGIYKTKGKTPRHFKVNNNMTKLYVANQDTNNIVVFDINNGSLNYNTEFICNSPNYILIMGD